MKRLFDLLAATGGLFVTLPFYPAIAAMIKLDSRGPVFYRQVRVGRGGRQFRILKFRTMADRADRGGAVTAKADSRVTRVGRWLRRFEVDELPTLFNVVKGDMSIVGPRPEAPRYVEGYSPAQRRVLEMRPGLTDLGTLHFRDEAAILANADDSERVYLEQVLPEKLKLNLEYLERQSLLFDLRLIVETLALIARRRKS